MADVISSSANIFCLAQSIKIRDTVSSIKLSYFANNLSTSDNNSLLDKIATRLLKAISSAVKKSLSRQTVLSKIKSCSSFEVVKEYLKKDHVVGVGEIGLEKCTKEEIDVFTEQILIAKELKMPVVVHTPRRNKEAVTKNIIEVLDTMDLPIDFKKKIVIEHVTKETVPIIWENDYKLGITVQPQKLTPNDAVEILGEYCEKRFLLNSDSSSAPSDIFGVPKTVLKLKMAGFDEKVINAVSHNNAADLFKIN